MENIIILNYIDLTKWEKNHYTKFIDRLNRQTKRHHFRQRIAKFVNRCRIAKPVNRCRIAKPVKK